VRAASRQETVIASVVQFKSTNSGRSKVDQAVNARKKSEFLNLELAVGEMRNEFILVALRPTI